MKQALQNSHYKKNMEKSKQPNYDEARNQALTLLDKFGYKKPYVDPLKICNDLGINVFFSEFKQDPNIAGFFYARDNSIFINTNEMPARQTFTMAHELGHSILHVDYINGPDYQVLYRTSMNDSGNKDWHEKEADCFAANLLVPRFMLDKYYKKLGASIEELSSIFVVPMPVIRDRIRFEYKF